jgi:fibronectin-binding autotransporter adhesin
MTSALESSHRPQHLRPRSGARSLLAILFAAVLWQFVWPERSLLAQVYNVDTAVGTGTGSLYWAIQQADAFGNGGTVSFQNLPFAQVNLDGPLPDITVGMTISGNSTTVNGENQRRIFFVNTPAGQTVQLNGLTLENGLAQGGNGNQGGGTGGGGAGLGGAVFVNAGAVTFSSVAFQNNSAVGGQGGSGGFGGGGGGGGISFAGGAGSGSNSFLFLGGGGGGGARSSSGINASSNGNGGTGGGAHGAMPGLGGSEDPRGLSTSLADGGGGGGGLDTSVYASNFPVPNGGAGSDFSGGGGGGSSFNNNAGNGGAGGFGAGGGGGADAGSGYAGDGGSGGFGGGGGGGGGTPNVNSLGNSLGGSGGFGGGNGADGNEGAGGGGAAFGGAVFVRSGATVAFNDSSTDAGSLTAGAGGNSPLGSLHSGSAGAAAGGALFLMGGNATFSVSAGNTQTIAGSIGQSSASSLTKSGAGTMVLTASNSYSGGTAINGGTLRLQNFGLPATAIVINSSGTLQYDTSTGNINQLRADLSGTGKLVKIGSGQLLFGNGGNNAINWNFSAGALIDVQAGTLVGGTSVNDFWTNDNASLNIAAGATFQGVEANVQIDALTGAGTFTGGYAFGGVETIGIANGSGSFSGSLQDTLTGSGYDLSIVKVGTGTETLSGASTYSGSTTVNDGTLAITSTGALGNGPLAVNAANGITSIASFSNHQSINSLSGSVAGTGMARVSVEAGGTFTVNQSASTVFAGSVNLASGPTSATAGALVKSNTGTLEIDGGLSLGNNSSLTVSGGKLRLNISGTASVGSGATSNITGSSVLELAGTVSALGTTTPPANRVAITNTSNATAGLLVSAGNQQVGGIGGTGSTQINAGARLTADHIIQTALVIGGTTGSHAVVTIAASDVSGNPLIQSNGFALAGSLTPGDPFGADGGIGSTDPSSGDSTDLAAVSLGHSATGDNPAAVPEPSTLLLGLIAVSGVIGRRLR